VIKGPQAATFGRATYSGAVDYITRTPRDNEFSGRAFGQWSSNSGNSNHNASVRVNIPVVPDKLWIAVNGTSLRRGELGENPADGEKVGIEETTAFGITLYAERNEDLSIKFRYGVDRDRDSIPAFYVEEPAEWAALGTNTQTVPGGFLWPDGKVPDARQGIAGGAEFLDADRPHRGWSEGVAVLNTDSVDAAWEYTAFMGGEEGQKIYSTLTGRLPNTEDLIHSFWIPTIEERFGVKLHPRGLEKALARRGKKAPEPAP